MPECALIDPSPPRCLPPQSPTQGRVALPAGATDCHCHIFGDPQIYPWTAQRSYTPAPASLDAYLSMCAAVGLQRMVHVNASVYGTANQLTLDIIQTLGQHRARGVVGVLPNIATAELVRLHAGGVRGVRVSTHVLGYGGTDQLEALAYKLKPLGWHLQIHVAHGDELAALETRLLRIDTALVFDHLGCVLGRDGVSSTGFQTLLRLIAQRDDCWVKLSGWYRRSAQAPPHQDMRPLVQALVATRPERLVYGSNWPHPNLFSPDLVPRDADLLASVIDWVPDQDIQAQIFVHNPQKLYGFPAP